MKKIIQVNERPPLGQAIPLSIQHMFAMFGASVLVPTLFHIDPAVVLLMNGLGTLFFIFITKGKAPAYLGSSFAFIATARLMRIRSSQTLRLSRRRSTWKPLLMRRAGLWLWASSAASLP